MEKWEEMFKDSYAKWKDTKDKLELINQTLMDEQKERRLILLNQTIVSFQRDRKQRVLIQFRKNAMKGIVINR